MIIDFKCPTCSGSIYEYCGLESKSWLAKFTYMHYILNPGLAFNELLLGQRMPKTILTCKACTTSLPNRSYVFCDSCGALHGLDVQKQFFGFGNYFGIYCPGCSKEIKTLRNLTAQIISLVCFPITYFPAKELKRKWLSNRSNQILLLKSNEAGKELQQQKVEDISYTKMGVLFGVSFYLFILLFLGIGVGAGIFKIGIPMVVAVSGFPLCALGGLAFGVLMKLMLDRKGDSSLHLDMDKLMEKKNSKAIEESKEDN